MKIGGVLWLAVLALGCHGEKSVPRLLQDAEAEDAGTKPADDAGAHADSSVSVSGPYDSCRVDTDCAWGEIDHEIETAKDCACLYGCPYLPLSKTTAERRMAKHDALCDPRHAGDGSPCGIDDCANPGRIVCNQGKCGAPDAGTR
jgi:hypothetical protein